VFAALLDAVEPSVGPHETPRYPTKLHADKGSDYPACRAALAKRGIADRIARRGIEDRQRLGRHRWVVERTLAWLARYRRLAIRYERHESPQQAFLDLGCALICLRRSWRVRHGARRGIEIADSANGRERQQERRGDEAQPAEEERLTQADGRAEHAPGFYCVVLG